MNSEQIYSLANSLLSETYIRINLIRKKWKIKMVWVRKPFHGICHFDEREIHLNMELLQFVSDSEIRDTILHEIAHALAYTKYDVINHNHIWKRICKMIGCKPLATNYQSFNLNVCRNVYRYELQDSQGNPIEFFNAIPRRYSLGNNISTGENLILLKIT